MEESCYQAEDDTDQKELEEGSEQREVKCRRRGPLDHQDCPAGPADYRESLAWAEEQVEGLQAYDSAHDTDLVGNIERTLRRGIVMTTHYSGHGTPEHALREICRCHGVPAVRPYSACDVSPAAQRMLAAHTHASEHIFDDIMDLLDDATKERLCAAHVTVKGKYDAAEQAQACPQTLEERQALVDKFGKEFVQRAHKILKSATWSSHAWCHQCNAYCKVVPDLHKDNATGIKQVPPAVFKAGTSCKHAAAADKQVWIEVSGVICVGFSSMGLKLKWLDQSAVICMVWAHWVQRHAPDIVLIECVSGWEPEPVTSLFPSSQWGIIQKVFCPSDLGHPIRRRRLYMAMVNKATFSMPVGLASTMDNIFDTCFFRKVVADGGIYMHASKEQRADMVQALAAKLGVTLSMQEALSVNPSSLMRMGVRMRFQEYQVCVQEMQMELEKGGKAAHQHVFVNIAQNIQHFKVSGSTCHLFPCLMRHSFLVDLGRAVKAKHADIVHPWESYASMGFPMSFDGFSDLASQCPWGDCSSSLAIEKDGSTVSYQDMISLIGNGMHCAAVGAFLQFIVGLAHQPASC